LLPIAFLIRLHCYDGRTTAPPLPSDDDDYSYDSYDDSYGASYGDGVKGGTNSYGASYGGGDVASGDIDEGEGEGEGEGGGTDKSARGNVTTRDRRPADLEGPVSKSGPDLGMQTGPSKSGPDLGRPARDRKRRERASKLGNGHTFQNRDRSQRAAGRAAAMPSARATAASKRPNPPATDPLAAWFIDPNLEGDGLDPNLDPLAAWFLELSVEGDGFDPNVEGKGLKRTKRQHAFDPNLEGKGLKPTKRRHAFDPNLEGDGLDPNLDPKGLKRTKRRHAAGAAAAAGGAAAQLVPFSSWLAPPRRLVHGFVNDPALIAALNAQPDLGWWAGTSEYMPGASLLALRRVRLLGLLMTSDCAS